MTLRTDETTRTPWVPPMEFDPARAMPAPLDQRDAPTPLAGELLPPPTPNPRRFAARALVFSLAGLVVAAIGIDTADLVIRAFAVSPWMGGVLCGLVAVAAGALGMMAGREWRAFSRLAKVDGLRQRAAALRAKAGHGKAQPVARQVLALYVGRPELERAREAYRTSVTDAHDDREVLDLAERTLLTPIDQTAYRLVVRASRDVALGTALSPAALLDAALVIWRNARLVREVASLYGARPGLFGSARLLRRMAENIAIAGVAESGDSIAVDALGGTVAAALSARIGQGVINGLLTARIGLTAMHLCRPLPFAPERRPRLAEIRKELLRLPKEVL